MPIGLVVKYNLEFIFVQLNLSIYIMKQIYKFKAQYLINSVFYILNKRLEKILS